MNVRIKLAVALVFFGLASSVSYARKHEKMGKRGGPCQGKIKEICGGVEKGEGRVQKCIEENLSKFPEECQKMMGEMKAERKEMREDFKESFADNRKEFKSECKSDIEKLCGDSKDNKLLCLQEKQEQASDSCKAVLVKNKSEREEFKEKRKSRMKEIREKYVESKTKEAPNAPQSSDK